MIVKSLSKLIEDIRPKQPSQHQRILSVLRRNKRITSADMVNMKIFQYNARIKELRDNGGHKIVCQRVKGHLFEYILVEDE